MKQLTKINLLITIYALILSCNNQQGLQHESGQNAIDTTMANPHVFKSTVNNLFNRFIVNPPNQAILELYPERLDSVLQLVVNKHVVKWRGRISGISYDTSHRLTFRVIIQENTNQEYHAHVLINLVVGSSVLWGVKGHLTAAETYWSRNKNKRDTTYRTKHSHHLVDKNTSYYNDVLNSNNGDWVEVSGDIDDVTVGLYWYPGKNMFASSYPVQQIDLLFSVVGLRKLNIDEVMTDTTAN